MRETAQAVVIGCSILYHLTKLGWSDVVLLERNELTSGSTWHAAANIHGLHDSTNISRIQHYTMNLYNVLEEETGQSCGVFQPGSLYLAQTTERVHQLRLQAAKAKLYGMNFYEISIQEARELNPMVNYDGIKCVMYEPDGGNVDPSGVTNAYAVGARQRGAEINRFTPVTATEPQADGSWIVKTPKGDIHTQWVVNVAGLWGREVAAMAGLTLPLQPTEHQYFVTESIPEIETADCRLPSVSDRDGEYYLRQEGKGLLVGAYEKDMKFWAEDGTPLDFAHDLFPDDLERIEENMMNAIERVPAVAEAGIKRVINGPMIWSPDANVLFGPVPELDNYFCCNGIIPGFSQSGGMGLMAAQWIIEGETHYDMFGWDVARFDTWADKAFTKARVEDSYAHRFAIHFPNEERAAGRPARMRPAYAKQAELGAVFGLNAGWEHPLWFADVVGGADTNGFTRQNWWGPVGEECKMLRDRAGIIDISNFAKYVCKGPGAAAATEDFPFMRSKRIELAGVDVLALRVSFTGDLGWELHCDESDQTRLYDALLDAGKEFGAGPVGGRALMSLRVEKGYGSWSREYSPEYFPQEVGLDRLCKMDKEFLNKDAVSETLGQDAREHMVLLHLHEEDVTASGADATGGEPIFKDGVGIGRVTSGTYGYTVGMSLALGFVKDAVAGDCVDVMVLGQPHRAVILSEPPFDPSGARLRA